MKILLLNRQYEVEKSFHGAKVKKDETLREKTQGPKEQKG